MHKKRAFVAEDSLLVMMSLETILELVEIDIAGAAASLADAMTLVQTCDADVAILDINLGDGMVYPAADILAARGIPIIFATGYATEKALLTRYAKARFLQKPYGVAAVLKLVTQSFEAAPLLGG